MTRALATLALGAWVAVVCTLGRQALTTYPNTGDEHSVLFQAKVFARLAATAPAPPVPDLFATDYLEIRHDRWYSQYPPLGPLLLVPGVWIGSVPLWMAVLAAGGLAATFAAARKTGLSAAGALAATVVLAASPSYLFHAASYYTHVPALLLVTLALALTLGRDASPPPCAAAAQGALLGAAFAVRPFTAACLAPLFFLHLLLVHRKLRPTLAFAAGFAAAAALIPLHAFLTTGDPLDVPYTRAGNNLARLVGEAGAWQRLIDLAGDSARWLLPLGIFARGTPKLAGPDDVFAGWIPAAVALAGALAAVVRGPGRRRADGLLLIGMVAALAAGHSLWAGGGGRFGARFLFEAFPAVAITLAWALDGLRPRGVIALGAVLAMAAYSAIGVMPPTVAWFRDNNRRRMTPYLMARDRGLTGAIIRLQDVPDFSPAFYARNEPDLTGNVWVSGATVGKHRQLWKRLPGRRHYVFRSRGDEAWVLDEE